MRYLPTIGLATALLLQGCQDKNPLKDFTPTSEKAFSTNDGAVKIYIRDHRTIYCEVAWETRHPDSGRPIKLTLSSSGGGRFYDIGEVVYLDGPETKPEY